MLPKLNRLQKTREFDRVFKNSKPVSTIHLLLRVAKNRSREGNVRFGFVVSNKIEKRSARRNALKRQLRAVTRSLISGLESGYDVVVVVRKNFSFPYKQEEIKEEFVEAMRRAGILKKSELQIPNDK